VEQRTAETVAALEFNVIIKGAADKNRPFPRPVQQKGEHIDVS
jgi:hypothetical protein